jgi:uncharacterized protein YbjT (DUF2867 family)
MENLFNPWNLSALRSGIYPSPIPVNLPLQQAAIADLLAFAVLAIERPDEFAGRRIPLASDEVKAKRAAQVFSAVTGRGFVAEQLPADDLPPPLRALFAWLERVAHAVDVEGLRSRHPDVGWHRYADWAESQRARFGELCPHPTPLG